MYLLLKKVSHVDPSRFFPQKTPASWAPDTTAGSLYRSSTNHMTTPDGSECPPPRFSHSFCDSLQIWKGEEICKKETWLSLKEM